MIVMDRLKMAMKEKGYTFSSLEKAAGVANGTISKWEETSPSISRVQSVCKVLGVTVDWILGNDRYDVRQILQASQLPYGTMMPIIGTVKAGYGGIAEEEFTGEYRMVTDINGYDPSECRLLNVSGDSMYPLLMEGDTVLVHIQPEVDNGQVAVIINDDEATMKRVKIGSGEITLIPENREYKVRTIKGEELRSVRIYGRVLSVVHRSIV